MQQLHDFETSDCWTLHRRMFTYHDPVTKKALRLADKTFQKNNPFKKIYMM